MLKLTYTETGFSLERLAQPLEAWITARVLLALRSGMSVCVEPSTAAFLLPSDLPCLDELELAARADESESVEIAVCDGDYIEVTLQGTWLASEPDSEEGIFVAVMSERTEFCLSQLWQAAQMEASVVNE
jgi:hypothetical protein